MDTFEKRQRIRIEITDETQESEHFHQDIELIYVLEGEVDVLMEPENTHLCSGDILVVNANKNHAIKGSQGMLLAKLMVSYETVGDIVGCIDSIFWCNSTLDENEHYEELRTTIRKLLAHYTSSGGNVVDFGHISLCYRILDILAVNFLVRTSDREGAGVDGILNNRIEQINNYVRGNYSSQMSLKDLAQKLYLSEAYLSRFFKKNYGMSFVKYVNNIRLSHAMDELLYTDEPITKIAYNNGFSNAALFNKNFKQIYGETPSQVRKRHRIHPNPEMTDDNQRLKERLENYFYKNAIQDEEIASIGLQKEIECSVSEYDEMPSLQQNLCAVINGGSAEELLHSGVQEHILKAKEDFSIKYVRIWNLFSPELLVKISNDKSGYNFSRVDNVLEFLVSNGLKPWLELGPKPKRIIKGVGDNILYKDEEGIKYDVNLWACTIDAFMRNINENFGIAEVENWVFELWNDERAKLDSDYDYIKLFETLSSVIRKRNKKCKIGGCGLREDWNKTGLKNFFTKWHQSKEQPDYLSVMYYPYERGAYENDYYSKRSTDNDGLLHCVERTRALCTECGFSPDIPIVVSEWNLTVSDRNYLNDSSYKAAYLIKNLIQIMNKADAVALFHLTDRTGEYFDTKGLLFGGMGFFSRDSISKPAALGLSFWKYLLPKVVARGENYIITADENHNYYMLCHNQKKLNFNYYLVDEGEIKKEELWKYFEDLDSLSLSVSLKDVEGGTYKVKAYRVNSRYGNVLECWRDLDYDMHLSKNDIQYISRECQPKLTQKYIKVENGILKMDFELAYNEVLFVRMSKID